MKKVLIINEGNSENLGDQLINFCIQNYFKEYQLSFQSYSCYDEKLENTNLVNEPVKTSGLNSLVKKIIPSKIKLNLNRLNWFVSNRTTFNKYKNADFDLVIIGGGQLLNSFWIFPLALYQWTKIFRNSNIVLFACGAVQINKFSFLERLLLKKGLNRCKELTFRDHQSIETIKKNFDLNATLIQDPVFGISNIFPQSQKLNQATILPFSFNDVYLFFNPSKMDYIQFLEFWVKKINSESLNYEKVVVTITDVFQDLEIYNELKKLKFSSNVEFKIPSNFNDLIQTISYSKYIYSGRMHALIIGYSYESECEIFPVSKKLEIFNEEILNKNSSEISIVKENLFKEIIRLKKIYIKDA